MSRRGLRGMLLRLWGGFLRLMVGGWRAARYKMIQPFWSLFLALTLSLFAAVDLHAL